MLTIEVQRGLNIGSGVAEFDDALQRYFVETDAFRMLVEDRADVVAGDKGTGKTALYKILQQRYAEISELASTEIIPAFNVTGSPIFQRLAEGEPYTEAQYMTLWKGYFLSLAGNWLLTVFEDAWSDSMYELDAILTRTGLRSADDSPNTIFSSIVNLFRRLTNPKSAELMVTISAEGLPVVVPKVEFGDDQVPDSQPNLVTHDYSFGVLDRCTNEVGLRLWLAMDRLDEAFAGLPAAEVPALRALLRTYLDLLMYESFRLKLFVRNDLFRRIIAGGFVNLTHINARKVQISWDEESLENLLELRVRENEDVLTAFGIEAGDPTFYRIFPEKVDPGSRKPQTWKWMMGRIRDGNYVRPRRNLIDLVQKSLDAAIRKEERDKTEFRPDQPLINSDAIKSGLKALRKERVEDTLLAEAGSEAPLIEKFRNGKAEHNSASVSELLGQTGSELQTSIEFLKEIGFLESSGTSVFLKIPILYRDGLSVTQGKAFVTGDNGEGEDDEDDEDQ